MSIPCTSPYLKNLVPSKSLEWWPSPKVRSKTAFVLSPKADKISLEKEADVDCRRINGWRDGVRLNIGGIVWPGIFSPKHLLAYIIWKLFKLRNIVFYRRKGLGSRIYFRNYLTQKQNNNTRSKCDETVRLTHIIQNFRQSRYLFSSWPESSSFWHCDPGPWARQLATPCAFSPVFVRQLSPCFWCTASPAQKYKKFISD